MLVCRRQNRSDSVTRVNGPSWVANRLTTAPFVGNEKFTILKWKKIEIFNLYLITPQKYKKELERALDQ